MPSCGNGPVGTGSEQETKKVKKDAAIQNTSQSSAAIPTTPSASAGGRVSFSGETQIKEIPRIGTRSTATLQPPRSKGGEPIAVETSAISTDSFFSSGGIIRERGVVGTTSASPVAASDGTTSTSGSRFITERIQGQDGRNMPPPPPAASSETTMTTTTTTTTTKENSTSTKRPLSRFARERRQNE